MRKLTAFLLLVAIFFAMSINIYAQDTVNLAGYGVATVDSYRGENSIPIIVVDGVVDPYKWTPKRSVKFDEDNKVYATRNKPSWIQIEFEIPTEIKSAKIHWAEDRAAVGHYKLLYSDDGESWTEASNFNVERINGDGSYLKPYTDTITFDPIKAIYYRMEAYAGVTEEGLGSVYEFELYGNPSQYDYLKKEVENKENLEDTPKEVGIITYVMFGVGVGIALVLLGFVVVKLLKKGDRKNA